VDDPLKVVSVTESDRTPRGSSGIGFSGCEVDDTGISGKVVLRGRGPDVGRVVDGMIESTAWTA
jgi:hypothetical protein